jgi:FtsH-binding integral membrane protein
MRFWLIAAAIALAGAVLGHFLKKRLSRTLAGGCAVVSAGLYLYIRLFVHHNGLGAGLAAITIWLFSAAAGLLLGSFTNRRKGNV